MINSPDANSHLCILLARKQPQGYACVTKVRHTSPVQSQPVLIWRISQSPPNSVVWYEPVFDSPVNNIHFGFLVVALDQE